jgi:integrase
LFKKVSPRLEDVNFNAILSGTDIRTIQKATEGLPFECFNIIHNKVLPAYKQNAIIICQYIISMKSEINLADNYRKSVIVVLSRLSMHLKYIKSFEDITREDLLSFLDSFRKSETLDPLHRWIGTYNLFRTHLMRFYKWLYYPNIEHKQRPKPPLIENIPTLKRKETAVYKPTDLWTEEDDSLFLKYCPSPRDRCYHSMAGDSAARPHELLKLKIKDVVFKFTPDKKQYAEVLVNGKTGNRSLPLINSIPYIKDWINQHPQGGNPSSILLCGFGKSLGRKIRIASIGKIYENYKHHFFPKLLDNPNVPFEDKQKIKVLLNKPWNPYIRRHSALTEKSALLKEHHLRQFAGWSPRSNMHLKYLHFFGNESNKSLLEAYGIVSKDQKLSNSLRPKQCPNCNEPNKPDSKFCVKCRMVLTYDAYNETLENQKEKQSEVQRLQQKYEQDMKTMREDMNYQFSQVMLLIQQNPGLAHIKPEILSKKIKE